MTASVQQGPASRAQAYTDAGVDSARQKRALKGLLRQIARIASPRQRLPIGLFANVLDLGDGKGLAVSMDGVGTKALIAQIFRGHPFGKKSAESAESADK